MNFRLAAGLTMLLSLFLLAPVQAQTKAITPNTGGLAVSTITPVIGASGANTIRVLLTPDAESTLASPSATRIREVNATLGSTFGAGKTLLAFDCDESMARLNMAKAELLGADESHKAKQRIKKLGQASEVEVALAASAFEKSRSQVALQQAQVRNCSIAAPWSGRVSKVHVRNHMSVAAGQPLLDVVKDGPLKLRLNVPSRILSAIRVGKAFDVQIEETGKSYPAKVTALNSRVDPVSQTIEIEAGLLKVHSELLAGMSGTASLPQLSDAR
jgi:RND family efflux transporter MFP subunit